MAEKLSVSATKSRKQERQVKKAKPNGQGVCAGRISCLEVLTDLGQ